MPYSRVKKNRQIDCTPDKFVIQIFSSRTILEIIPAAPVLFMFRFISIFPYIVTQDYSLLPYPQTLFSICGHCWRVFP